MQPKGLFSKVIQPGTSIAEISQRDDCSLRSDDMIVKDLFIHQLTVVDCHFNQ